MRLLCATIFLLSACFYSASAQSKKDKKKKQDNIENQTKDNSFSPFSTAESAVKDQQLTRKKRKAGKNPSFSASYRKMLNQKKEEFEKRMKQNAKDDRREARIMKKPQYSDPSYFGHKRKPKKRKPGKRKLCKECGIIH